MALIEVRGLKKEYLMGSVVVNALRGIDVSIDKGEFVSLVGPSGSGKSTLMHLIGGLDYPTEGTVVVGGEDIYALDESELAAFRGRRVGFVFQSFNLFNLLSARENVYFPMQFSDIPFGQWASRADELLELVKLGDWRHHKPTEMSGGQQQRVAIARALANDPAILLGDEPTGELDTATKREIMALFDRIRRERGTTVIIVTHDPEMAKLTDRMIHIVDGLVRSDGRNGQHPTSASPTAGAGAPARPLGAASGADLKAPAAGGPQAKAGEAPASEAAAGPPAGRAPRARPRRRPPKRQGRAAPPEEIDDEDAI